MVVRSDLMTTPTRRHTETVHVSITGTDGKEYKGAFTWARRTLADIPLIAAETSRLMNGMAVPQTTVIGSVVLFMAELNIVTEKAPVWWDFNTLYDVDIVAAVYNRYQDWRDSFFRPKPAIEGDPRDEESAVSEVSGDPKPLHS